VQIREGQFAFDDAVAIVATSNTIGALHKRLVSHPLVQYLADKFSTTEIERKLIAELQTFDRTLHKATIILLLALAYFRALGRPPIPEKVKVALTSSEVKWARDLIQFYEPRNEVPMSVLKVPPAFSARLHQSATSTVDRRS
jgi:hypothetical protein